MSRGLKFLPIDLLGSETVDLQGVASQTDYQLKDHVCASFLFKPTITKVKVTGIWFELNVIIMNFSHTHCQFSRKSQSILGPVSTRVTEIYLSMEEQMKY